jgi:hypothetical protein
MEAGQESRVLAHLAFVDGDTLARVRFGGHEQAWGRAEAEQFVDAARQQSGYRVVSVRGRQQAIHAA